MNYAPDCDAITVRHVEGGEYIVTRSHPGKDGDGAVGAVPKCGEMISASSLAWYESRGVRVSYRDGIDPKP